MQTVDLYFVLYAGTYGSGEMIWSPLENLLETTSLWLHEFQVIDDRVQPGHPPPILRG